MFGLGQRTRRFVVAIVHDRERQGFLLVYNPRWHAYTFPSRRFPDVHMADALQERDLCERIARQILRDDLGPTLGEVSEAHWMDRVEISGISGQTGRVTNYLCDVVTLVPVEQLPVGAFASRFGFLTSQEILQSRPEHSGHLTRLLPFTTWEILRRLLEDQHVAAAVVCRCQEGKREFLMTSNRYGRFFFPGRRMGDGMPAERLIVYEFRLGANFNGKMEVQPGPVVRLEQETPHLGKRGYTFHLCPTAFPGEELTLEANRLANSLDQAGIRFRWISEDELRHPPDILSETVQGLAETVLGMAR
jgi:hypothetical protein